METTVVVVFSYAQTKNGELEADHFDKTLKNFMYIDTNFTIKKGSDSAILRLINETKYKIFKSRLVDLGSTYGGFYKLQKTTKCNRLLQLHDRLVIPLLIKLKLDSSIDDPITAIDNATVVSFKILESRQCNKDKSPAAWKIVKPGCKQVKTKFVNNPTVVKNF